MTAAQAADWQPAKGRLDTRWAADVTPENVHQEYPRPQLVRDDWQNLNGLWDYAIVPKDDAQPESFAGKILVPFPAESSLSGVMKEVGDTKKLWYRRSFTVPEGWSDQRVVLHFGAVDFHAVVSVNGQQVGEHRGGYDPFHFDVTDALSDSGEQELVVSVWDPTDAGTQARGKQLRKPQSIWYTPVTGIWQTVWLEPVSATHITSLKIVPNVNDSQVAITVNASDATRRRDRVEIEVVSRSLGDQVETLSGPTIRGQAGNTFTLSIPDAKLWSPDEPWLYQFQVTVGDDTVTSYFGLRTSRIGKDVNGTWRLMLNEKPLFHYGPLDQGWWPDGLYSPPSDAALLYDLEVTKQLGFNMVRKHVKVESARWYYHCDRMGLMVWQDMPNGDRHIRPEDDDIVRTPESTKQYETEWKRIIDANHNNPCIVLWVPFNEGWGQFDTKRITDWTKSYDPTRIVNSASGWTDRGEGEVLDIHAYPGPAMPAPREDRAVVLGEFGGLGLPVDGHTWQNQKNWGYRNYKNEKELDDAYHALIEKLSPLIDTGLAAAVYTQTTDVESEVNGFLTYDRAKLKMNADRAAAAHKQLYRAPRILTIVVPNSTVAAPRSWQYTTTQPKGDWQKAGFDTTGWSQGNGGFGTKSTPGAVVGTEWSSSDIWLRQEVEISELPINPQWRIHHDENAEVYINGQLVGDFPGYTSSIVITPMSETARKALKLGKNLIAVKCHQTDGGQFFDVGIIDIQDPPTE